MRKILSFAMFFLAMTTSTFSQNGRNDFILAVEAGLPTGDFKGYKTGFGVTGKLLIGVEEYSQISLTSGYTLFTAKGSTDDNRTRTSVIPFLVGYRYNLRPLYFEPQLGYGKYGVRSKTEIGGVESSSSSSRGAFTWAFAAGLRLKALDLGARYQIGYRKGSSVGFFGLHLGYNLLADRD